MSPEQIEDRHGEVAGMYAQYQLDPHATLRSIGAERGGVTAERIRQRFTQAGLPSRTISEMAALRREQRLTDVRDDPAKRGALHDLWVEGVSISDIARRLDLTTADVKDLAGELMTASDDARRETAVTARRAAARGATWGAVPGPELLGELTAYVRLAWEAQGRPEHFTGGHYDQAARLDRGLPSLSTLIIHYRWAELLHRARLAGRPSTRRSGYPRITPEECWKALRVAAAEMNAPNSPPVRRDYVRHSTGRRDLPCAATVERRLGGWSQIEAQWPGPPRDPDGGPTASKTANRRRSPRSSGADGIAPLGVPRARNPNAEAVRQVH